MQYPNVASHTVLHKAKVWWRVANHEDGVYIALRDASVARIGTHFCLNDYPQKFAPLSPFF